MGKWNQKVKARAHESEDEGDDFDVDGGSSPSVLETGDVGDIMSSGDDDDASEEEDGESRDYVAYLRTEAYTMQMKSKNQTHKSS